VAGEADYEQVKALLSCVLDDSLDLMAGDYRVLKFNSAEGGSCPRLRSHPLKIRFLNLSVLELADGFGVLRQVFLNADHRQIGVKGGC